MKPGDIVTMVAMDVWWGLNLERTAKVPSDMGFAIVVSTRETRWGELAYSVLLLTRDMQLTWMRKDMLRNL